MLRVLVLLLATAILRADDAFDLLRFVPPQANTVAIINTADILSCPRAVKDGWAKLEHTEYLAGAVPLNPLVERMVLAKQTNPEAPGSGTVMAVMPLTKPVDLARLATMVKGSETTVNGEPAVLSANGTYFVKLGDKLLGAIRTESKQEVSRWLKFAKSAKESQLHKTLNVAAAQSTAQHITVALDTDDLFHDIDVEVAVGLTKSVPIDAVQSGELTAFFKQMKGVIFTAKFTSEGIQARLRFESTHAALKLDAEIAKAFVLEAMGRHGALLADLTTSKPTISENRTSVSLSFLASDADLGRVMSLVLPPMAIPAEDTIAVVSDKPNAQSTLKFFNAVNAILDDLQAQTKKADDYTKTALWHETAAGKIDLLSMIGVDKAVIEYGHGSVQRLYSISESLRGVPAKVEELAGQSYAYGYVPRRGVWGGRFNPWAYGGTNVTTNVGEITNKQAQVVKDDAKARETLWASIDGKRSETRTMILEKHQVTPPARK